MPVIAIRSIQDMLPIFIKDIPLEHVVRGTQLLDQAAFFRYFKGYRLQKLPRKRLQDLVEREIVEKGNEKLAELFLALWNRANDDLYHEMLVLVKRINEDVESIKRIEDDTAKTIVDTMKDAYPLEKIFICVVANQVRFSPEFVKATFGRELPERPEEPEATPEVATDAPAEKA
jgi:hypothetical protein